MSSRDLAQLVLCIVGAAAAIATGDALIMAAVGLALVVALLVDAVAKGGKS